MKKAILPIVAAIALALGFSSCEHQTMETMEVTIYPGNWVKPASANYYMANVYWDELDEDRRAPQDTPCRPGHRHAPPARYDLPDERIEFGRMRPTLAMAAGVGVELSRHIVLEARYTSSFTSTDNYFEGVEFSTRSHWLGFNLGYVF